MEVVPVTNKIRTLHRFTNLGLHINKPMDKVVELDDRGIIYQAAVLLKYSLLELL